MRTQGRCLRWSQEMEKGSSSSATVRCRKGHDIMAIARHNLENVACPDCDLLQHIPELAPGDKARCARCGHLLASQSADPLDRPLALTIAAALAFIIANTTSLMDLSAVGRFASTTIPYGAYEMWMQGQRITAVIVAFCAVIAPGAYILFMLTVLIAVRRPPAPPWIGEQLRWGNSMQPWSMGAVMMLGVMVALITIAELASVGVGIGLDPAGALGV